MGSTSTALALPGRTLGSANAVVESGPICEGTSSSSSSKTSAEGGGEERGGDGVSTSVAYSMSNGIGMGRGSSSTAVSGSEEFAKSARALMWRDVPRVSLPCSSTLPSNPDT